MHKISGPQRIQQYFKKCTKVTKHNSTNSTKLINPTTPYKVPKVWVDTPEQIIARQKEIRAYDEYLELKREYQNSMQDRIHLVKPLDF
jgi:hypothetical protein